MNDALLPVDGLAVLAEASSQLLECHPDPSNESHPHTPFTDTSVHDHPLIWNASLLTDDSHQAPANSAPANWMGGDVFAANRVYDLATLIGNVQRLMTESLNVACSTEQFIKFIGGNAGELFTERLFYGICDSFYERTHRQVDFKSIDAMSDTLLAVAAVIAWHVYIYPKMSASDLHVRIAHMLHLPGCLCILPVGHNDLIRWADLFESTMALHVDPNGPPVTHIETIEWAWLGAYDGHCIPPRNNRQTFPDRERIHPATRSGATMNNISAYMLMINGICLAHKLVPGAQGTNYYLPPISANHTLFSGINRKAAKNYVTISPDGKEKKSRAKKPRYAI